ncbi:MAG: adenylosuccinate synthase [Phycisphaerales bacterium]|nr:adenylosuccinate synthase [Phycisphaerales bacterium]MCI0630994.1 adenylosuccinate synthase [Phycisphaerales bacterium]MCI0676762.1 adenylosuccinate synthase [Phycisphaerales bacterium]
MRRAQIKNRRATNNRDEALHTAVVGLQWGDEGKGKIVDLLTADHDVIVRYNGGANAGHTMVVGDQRYAVHLIPAGILYPDKVCVIGNGVVVDPQKLIEEIEALRGRGVEVGDNLRVSDRAHVVMPYHKEHDAALENVLSKAVSGSEKSVDLSIGTTRRGIGPAYADKVQRSTAIRMGELLDGERLRAKLRVICAIRQRELEALGVQAAPLNADALASQHAAIGRRLAGHITDTVYLLHDYLEQDRRILFEGANACLLDIDHGTYPYVTSSNCSTLGIPAGTGVPGTHIHRVLGIMKAYSTRVGAGPFPTEQVNAIGDRIRERGHEYGTTTGRPRRCGWLDLVAVRYSAMVCGATGLACMLLDVLSGIDELKICTQYRLPDGSVTDRFIPDAVRLGEVQPIYTTLPGWSEEIDEATDRTALPANARRYLERIEQIVGIPVEIVSVGPERTQTLLEV